ncbi:MAG TPA: hypothetical protein VKA21_14010 [Candidatus Binatia bacterium]|nr:hypothetical protein [Candidatus Binatia bacterium]
MGKVSYASVQSLVSVLAGIASLGGALYSAVRFVTPATGEIVAVVQPAGGDVPLPATTVEILTLQDVVVDTLTASGGTARRVVDEGAYRVRVSADRCAPQIRDVQVRRGTTAEVRFELAQRSDDERLATRKAEHERSGPVSRGVGAAQRFFGRLGL